MAGLPGSGGWWRAGQAAGAGVQRRDVDGPRMIANMQPPPAFPHAAAAAEVHLTQKSQTIEKSTIEIGVKSNNFCH